MEAHLFKLTILAGGYAVTSLPDSKAGELLKLCGQIKIVSQNSE